jgi:hypothetical protein
VTWKQFAAVVAACAVAVALVLVLVPRPTTVGSTAGQAVGGATALPVMYEFSSDT